MFPLDEFEGVTFFFLDDNLGAHLLIIRWCRVMWLSMLLLLMCALAIIAIVVVANEDAADSRSHFEP